MKGKENEEIKKESRHMERNGVLVILYYIFFVATIFLTNLTGYFLIILHMFGIILTKYGDRDDRLGKIVEKYFYRNFFHYNNFVIYDNEIYIFSGGIIREGKLRYGFGNKMDFSDVNDVRFKSSLPGLTLVEITDSNKNTMKFQCRNPEKVENLLVANVI